MPSINDLGDYELKIILIARLLLSTIFIILGILIHRYKYYNLIAGYNSAAEHIKKQYDIEVWQSILETASSLSAYY